jgi:chemotaxis protein CheZ
MNMEASADSADLEALFDSIAYAAPAAPPPAAECEPAAAPTVCLTNPTHTCSVEKPANCHAANCPADKIIDSVGHLTRRLHDTLIELGYDRQLQECAAGALPDARQRLAYVATLTEQAASRSLNAVELAAPLQAQLASEATGLAARWDEVFAGRGDPQELKAVAEETRTYLKSVRGRTDETRSHLREVMMAQEFQDLTGQVLKRVTELAEDLEKQLLMLLVENASGTVKLADVTGLHGPNIGGPGSADAITDQAQVDALLESLGF